MKVFTHLRLIRNLLFSLAFIIRINECVSARFGYLVGQASFKKAKMQSIEIIAVYAQGLLQEKSNFNQL